MRILSLFLSSLLLFNLSFAHGHSSSSNYSSSHASPKGYVRDAHGRTFVYRAQPSLWLLPSGAVLTFLGGLMTYGAYHERSPKLTLYSSLKLSDFLPDDFFQSLPKFLHFLSRMHIGIPLPAIEGKPARTIKCTLGAGVTASGAALLASFIYNYAKLSTPLIVIDHEGLHYEGKDKIYWKEVKSVRVVVDTSVNWQNDTGRFKEDYALEIVDSYGKLLIAEKDIAITVDALYDVIKQYHKRWW